MQPSDAALAALCAQIYSPTALTDGFDHYDAGMDDGVCWALKKVDGFDVIVFRGSKTVEDWIRDFQAIAVPSRVGHVHDGFFESMEKVWAEVWHMISQPMIVTGHSLGAARADIITALMVVDGHPPVSRVVFGEPKPGLLDLAQNVIKVPGRSYRNGNKVHHDLVTDVPFSFPPEEYVHPTEVIPICCEPSGDEFATLGVFAWHHIGLYETALATLDITL